MIRFQLRVGKVKARDWRRDREAAARRSFCVRLADDVAAHETVDGPKPTCNKRLKMSAYWVPAQPVDATQALNLSAGVSNSKVFRGRSFS